MKGSPCLTPPKIVITASEPYSISMFYVNKKDKKNFEKYGNFKFSNRRGMHSIKAIRFIFDRNMSLSIIHHHMKFY